MSLALGGLIGVVSSVVASTIWLVTIRAVRPRVDISSVIAEEGEGEDRKWRIKIINRARRAALDIEFELVAVRPASAMNGAVNFTRSCRVGRAPIILPGVSQRRRDDDNCYRLRIHDNPREMLAGDDGRFLRLRLFARDEVSGIGRVFESRYTYEATQVVRGRFARGQVFDVA